MIIILLIFFVIIIFIYYFCINTKYYNVNDTITGKNKSNIFNRDYNYFTNFARNNKTVSIDTDYNSYYSPAIDSEKFTLQEVADDNINYSKNLQQLEVPYMYNMSTWYPNIWVDHVDQVTGEPIFVQGETFNTYTSMNNNRDYTKEKLEHNKEFYKNKPIMFIYNDILK
jgi:hypothetical protein